MNKIIITGGSGFVGSNLTKHLANKQKFVVDAVSVRSHINDIFLVAADVIIHLAGKAHDLKKTSNEDEYFTVNTELTIELFDLFLESDINDFIYFSSVKAVADTVTGVLEEGVAPMPLTPYGQSKQQAEAYMLAKQLPQGKRVFIIRPCMIHGPGNKGNLNLLFKVVETGIPYPLAAFDNQRSFLSIDNLNYIIEKLITDKTIAGGIYNVADDEPLSTNELIETIAEVIGRKPKLWRLNKGLVKKLASLGDLLHLPLNSERLKKLTESYVVSNAKIKAALKIEQLPNSSKEGIRTTIKSFNTTHS